MEYVGTASLFLGNTLGAALDLGNIAYLSTDIMWLSNLLIERNISLSMLPVFLDLYAQAVREVMGEDGQPISDWLTLEAQKLKV